MIFKLIFCFLEGTNIWKFSLSWEKIDGTFLPHAQAKIKPMTLARFFFFYLKSFNVCVKIRIHNSICLIMKIKWANAWEVVNDYT